MRQFNAEDGQTWVARIHDGLEDNRPVDARTGWEVIEFDTGSVQKITYRPAGWLENASIQELIAALREGESVRSHWGTNI